MKATMTEMTVWKSTSLLERLEAAERGTGRPVEAPKALGSLHGSILCAAVRNLRKPEVLAFLADGSVGRGARLAAVASLDDVDVLIEVAVGAVPLFVRSAALRRIDELCDGVPLPESQIRRLVPCFDEPKLIAFAIVLMDVGDYDWCVHCTRGTVDSLCSALYDNPSIHETVILEDAFAYLAHSRPDLREWLQAYKPDQFLNQTTFAPVSLGNVFYTGPSQEANVA